MLTWKVEFEDDHTETVEATSGLVAMFRAERLYQLLVEAQGGKYQQPAVTSCREVCVEHE